MANFVLNVKVNGVEQSVSTIGELEDALEATKDELKGIEIGSDAFKELTAQARTLQGELENSFEKATNFNGQLDNIAQSVGRLGSTVAAGFAVVTAAFGIFGDESEDLTEAQIKAQQALAIAFGATTIATNAARLNQDLKNVADALGLTLTRANTAAQEVNTAVKTANTAATAAGAAAQTAFSAATGAATTAVRTLTAAIAANPLGALLVAITAVVGALILFGEEEKNVSTASQEVTASLLEQNEALKSNQDEIVALYEKEIELRLLRETDNEKRVELEKQLYKTLNGIQEEYINDNLRNSQRLYDSTLEDIDEFFTELNVKNDESAQSFQETAETIRDFKLFQLLEEIEATDESLRDFEKFRIRELQIEQEYNQKILDNARFFATLGENADNESYQKKIEALQANLDNSFNQLKNATSEQVNFQIDTDIEEAKRAEEARKKVEEEQKKKAEAYKKALDEIRKFTTDTYDELEKLDDQYYDKLADAQAKSDAERLQNEQIRAAINLNNIRTNALKEIQESVLSNKEKQKAIDELEEYFKDAQDSQAEYFKFKSDEIVAEEQKKADKIKLIQDILQQEISFGDQNTLDRLETITARELELETQKLQFTIDSNQVRLRDFNSVQDQILASTKQSLQIRRDVELAEASASRERDLQNLRENLESEFGEEFLLTQEYRDIINQAEINSQEELNQRLAEINENYRQQELEADRNTAQAKRDIYAQYLSFATQGLQAFSNLEAAATNAQLNRAKGNAAAEEKIRKESFKRQKALNIVGAVINGAQAVLQAIATFGPPPSPLGIAGIAAAGILTASQIALIASQKYQSSSASAGSISTPSVSTPSVGGASTIADATGGGFTGFNNTLTGTPTGGSGTNTGGFNPTSGQRVYVLESDITNTQNRVSVLEGGATFG